LISTVETARRLARAIASDILLYNHDAAKQARATGVAPASLTAAIEEGRELFRQRVVPEHGAVYDQAIEDLVLQKRARP
jgi:hypothetical protein